MKKFLPLLCGLLFGLAITGSAFAAGPVFSINVPETWSVALVSPDGQCTVSVFAERDNGSMTLEEQASAVAQGFNGTSPQKISAQEYIVYYQAEGVAHRAVIALRDKIFYLVTTSGEHPETAGILSSIATLGRK